MEQARESFPLTPEQFDALVALMEAASLAAINDAIQKNTPLRESASRRYAGQKQAARRLLVGET